MTLSDIRNLFEHKTKTTFIRWIRNPFALSDRHTEINVISQSPRYDVFISYARKDEDFVHKLENAFDQHNRNYWLDRKDIRHTEEWLNAIYSGIEAADNFIFIITKFSVASENCAKELGHAIKHRKRLIPVLHEDVDGSSVPVKLAELDWVPFRESDDFDACIQKLIDAINTDLEHVRMHTRVLTRALEWDARIRPRSLLLRGGSLREAEGWLSNTRVKKLPEATPLQVQYISASRKATWMRLTIICATSVALIAVLLFAQAQRNQAKSRRLAIESSATLSTDPELSLLLATEAWQASHTQEAENAMRHALNESRLRVTSRDYTKGVDHITFSPDGKYILTTDGNTALLSEAATGKRFTEYSGHSWHVLSAAFSRDGRLIVTTSADGTARVRNAVTGATISVLKGHEPKNEVIGTDPEIIDTSEHVYSGAFSHDSRLIITAGADKTARVWDARTGEQLKVLRGHQGDVMNAAFSPDGMLVVTVCTRDRTARVWDTSTWQQVAELVGPTSLKSAAFSPDSQYIVAAYADLYVPSNNNIGIIWEVRTGKSFAELRGHESGLVSAAYSPNGDHILTASFDNTARLWNGHSGELVSVLRGHLDNLGSASFSPNGRFVVTSSGDETARVWEVTTGSLITVLGGHKGEVNSAIFSPDGTYIATASNDKTVRVWDPNLHTKVLRPKEVEVAVLSQDLRLAATTPLSSNPIQIWDVNAEQVVCQLGGHGARIDFNGLDFSPNGQFIAGRTNDGKVVYIWDSKTGQAVAELKGHNDFINRFRFSKNGKLLITSSHDKTARVWEVGTERLLKTLSSHKGYVIDATFSNNGKLAVTASQDKTAQLWDLTTWTRLNTLNHTKPLDTVTFSPDDKYIVTTGYDSEGTLIKVWEVETGQAIADLKGHNWNVNTAFSSDGKLLATAGYDGSLRVWELRSGENVLTLPAHPTRVYGIEFSPNDRLIMTTGQDRTIRVWDAQTGGKVGLFRVPVPKLIGARFHPENNKSIVALGITDRVVIQNLTCDSCVPVDDLLNLSCDHLTRNLSLEEWKIYMNNESYRKTCEQLP